MPIRRSSPTRLAFKFSVVEVPEIRTLTARAPPGKTSLRVEESNPSCVKAVPIRRTSLRSQDRNDTINSGIVST